MERFLGRYTPFAFALMRIIIGLLFACHGGQKILGMFGGKVLSANVIFELIGSPFRRGFPPDGITAIAGTIELIGGFLVAFGLFGGYAAFLCSGLMAFAYFMAHARGGFFPIVNHGEPAVIYCFVFLYIACHGSGILSLDQVLFRRAAASPDLR